MHLILYIYSEEVLSMEDQFELQNRVIFWVCIGIIVVLAVIGRMS
jgi:hypothetical protein